MNHVSNVCFFGMYQINILSEFDFVYLVCLQFYLSFRGVTWGHAEAEDMLTPICVFPHLEDMQNVDHHCIFLKVGRRYWQNSNRKEEDRKLT